MKILRTLITCVCVIASLIAALFFYVMFNPDTLFKDKTPVNANEINTSSANDYIGRIPGDDIPRVKNAKDFYESDGCITVCTDKVISTGIYRLKSWVSPTKTKRVGYKRRTVVNDGPKATVVKSDSEIAMEINSDYLQYYIIKLEDNSYILTKLTYQQAKKIKKGKKITLPIGIKDYTNGTEQKSLNEICQKYDIDNKYFLNIINEDWYKKNNGKITIVHIGLAIIVFFVIGVILILATEKLFKINLTD